MAQPLVACVFANPSLPVLQALAPHVFGKGKVEPAPDLGWGEGPPLNNCAADQSQLASFGTLFLNSFKYLLST